MLRDDQANQFISKSHVTWAGLAEAWQPVLLRRFSVLTSITVKEIGAIHHALRHRDDCFLLAENADEHPIVFIVDTS